ncbi:MAG: tetraacyldisaccharide 4'-kinase [Chitinophagaceae bacterium]|nr:tetraacyldisaccharide 4'-kinase [Chitinophagaceae bacterium]
MFSNWFLKSFRILLLPFALIVGFFIWLRNWFYDVNVFKSASFGLPIICVGNLSVGGTGKSPMVEYLVLHLKNRFKVATVSRGYKRKTTGYALATAGTTALDIGDEPMLFYRKFHDVPVAVGEERLVAIPQLLHDRPDVQAIILDDAFQHRAIDAGLNILLTDYGNLFTRDFFLPTGDLRDLKKNYRRAHIIVVSKCNPDLTEKERKEIISEIKPLPHQKIFFTTIIYGAPYHITQNRITFINEQTEALLVTGIANPKPLKKYLEEHIHAYYMMHFGDHHIFTIDELQEIESRFMNMQAPNKIILTTEKDAMRLMKFENEIRDLPFFVLPIEHKFLFNQSHEFNSMVIKFIENFKRPVVTHGAETSQAYS